MFSSLRESIWQLPRSRDSLSSWRASSPALTSCLGRRSSPDSPVLCSFCGEPEHGEFPLTSAATKSTTQGPALAPAALGAPHKAQGLSWTPSEGKHQHCAHPLCPGLSLTAAHGGILSLFPEFWRNFHPQPHCQACHRSRKTFVSALLRFVSGETPTKWFHSLLSLF